MNYLSDYMKNRQTKLFAETHSFFAFNGDQLDEGVEPEFKGKYVNMGAGLICPKIYAKQLSDGLGQIYKECIELDIKENGLDAIIIRELGNHEAYYTQDLDQTETALKDYKGATIEKIREVFNRERVNQSCEF